jgi:nicotinate phosphoribosyltransferase
VRLDSGNVSELAGQVREVLDAGGLEQTAILVSGDLDEYRIDQILAGGAPVDGFGVGTQLVTGGDAPALGGVYKLVESDGRPVMKTSSRKATLPGRHQVFRDGDTDTIGLADEALPGRPLLEPVLLRGERPARPQPLDALRERARAEVAALPAARRRNRSPEVHLPRLSSQLQALKESLT